MSFQSHRKSDERTETNGVEMSDHVVVPDDDRRSDQRKRNAQQPSLAHAANVKLISKMNAALSRLEAQQKTADTMFARLDERYNAVAYAAQLDTIDERIRLIENSVSAHSTLLQTLTENQIEINRRVNHSKELLDKWAADINGLKTTSANLQTLNAKANNSLDRNGTRIGEIGRLSNVVENKVQSLSAAWKAEAVTTAHVDRLSESNKCLKTKIGTTLNALNSQQSKIDRSLNVSKDGYVKVETLLRDVVNATNSIDEAVAEFQPILVEVRDGVRYVRNTTSEMLSEVCFTRDLTYDDDSDRADADGLDAKLKEKISSNTKRLERIIDRIVSVMEDERGSK